MRRQARRTWIAGLPVLAVTVLAVTVLAGLAVAGCQSSVVSSTTSTVVSSGSSGVSIPGTHRSTTVYQIGSPVSTLVVTGHAGDVTVTGGAGPGTSVTEQVTYSKTPPATTRTFGGGTLTVTYSCAVQVVCSVSYDIQVPRNAAVRVSAAAGAIRLSGLAGDVTARADAGIITASGLTSPAATLTTSVGAITAAFTAPPATVQATASVGAVTIRVPAGTSYQVSADARIGKATISVPQSPSAPHTISATTDVGTILVGPPA
jgi:hypothetical protein